MYFLLFCFIPSNYQTSLFPAQIAVIFATSDETSLGNKGQFGIKLGSFNIGAIGDKPN